VIPLYHDFTGETVLVLGGGRVGARKARRFATEATAVVVAPDFAASDYGGAELVRAAPRPEDVAAWVERTDPALVVAATDDAEVNEAAERAARERGALVNRADESGGRDAGSVVVPATVEDGDVQVAISTGGQSPALSKYLREEIEAELEGASEMAALTGDLRSELRADGYAPTERREAVRAVVRSPRVWKALRRGKTNARREAACVIRDTTGGDR
jgi:precorrin-2 dehydrogenase/sirohydrochlorin ferrochelatase